MEREEPIEHELIKTAVAAEISVTCTEVSPTSTGDRFVRIEGRLGDDEESHVEWAAFGFLYVIGLMSFESARPRGNSDIDFQERTPGVPRTCSGGFATRTGGSRWRQTTSGVG